MYKYIGYDSLTGNGMAKSGTLVECLKLARRNWQRLGIPGNIYRPDNTSMRDRANKPKLPGEYYD